MRRLIAIVFLLAAFPAIAAHLYLDPQNFRGIAITNRQVTITPKSVISDGPKIYVLDSYVFQTTGVPMYISNVVGEANYIMQVAGHPTISQVTLLVPDTNGVVNIGDLVVSTVTVTGGNYVRRVGDPWAVTAGTGIITETNGAQVSVAFNFDTGWTFDGETTINSLSANLRTGSKATNTSFYPAAGGTTAATFRGDAKGTNFIDAANVRHWGALGDGATDDTAAISNAVAYASTTSGHVFIPAGTFLVSTNIKLLDNITFYGVGSDSIIKLASAKNTDILRNSDWTNGNTNIYIHSLFLDGNRANQSTVVGDGPGQSLITLVNSRYCRISHVVGKSPYLHGIEVGVQDLTVNTNNQASRDITIDNCEFYDFGDDGITTHFSERISISQCVLHDGAGTYSSSSNGIEVDDGSSDVTIAGCIAFNNVRAVQIKGHEDRIAAQFVTITGLLSVSNEVGIGLVHSGTNQTTAEQVVISGCSMHANSGAAINLEGYSKVNISDCILSAEESELGVFLYGSPTNPVREISITGCKFQNTYFQTSTTGTNVNGVLIQGCNFTGNSTPTVSASIISQNASGGISVDGCEFYSNNVRSILFTKVPSVRISNNYVHDNTSAQQFAWLIGCDNAQILNNRITSSYSAGSGIYLEGTHTNCLVANNLTAPPLMYGLNIQSTNGNATVVDNLFYSTSDGLTIVAAAGFTLTAWNNIGWVKNSINGSIGVGTNGPVTPLHVVGNVTIGRPGTDGGKIETNSSGLVLCGPSGSPEFYVQNGYIYFGDGTSYVRDTGEAGFTTRVRTAVVKAYSGLGLSFQDDDAVLAMFVEDGGYVGINTNNPVANLDIIGSVGTAVARGATHYTGMTTNINAIIAIDGAAQTTNQLQFVNGLLIGVLPYYSP